MVQRSNWCLIGVPDHSGVLNVGGRVGAAGGPRAFRKAFGRLKGRGGVLNALSDHGDAAPLGLDVAANHRQAADCMRAAHLASGLTVMVGGGHDHGYSQLLGLSEALSADARIGCINIDAHLDVRKPSPEIGSGSPFFLAIESGVLAPSRLIEFGIQDHCNDPVLWNYVESKHVSVRSFRDLRHGAAAAGFSDALSTLVKSCDAIVISLDLDAVSAAFAPGVSAPQAEGFTPSDIVEMMEIAGSEAKVVSLGVFELNPEHDIDGRTAALGATAAYHFIARALKGHDGG